MNGSRIRLRRDALWAIDPHCTSCGIKTILPSEIAKMTGKDVSELHRGLHRNLQHVMATLDHEVNRFDPMRQVKENRERTRLMCWKCNFDRGVKDYHALPAEVRQEMSSRPPRSSRS